jgi:hypothetical protein
MSSGNVIPNGASRADDPAARLLSAGRAKYLQLLKQKAWKNADSERHCVNPNSLISVQVPLQLGAFPLQHPLFKFDRWVL